MFVARHGVQEELQEENHERTSLRAWKDNSRHDAQIQQDNVLKFLQDLNDHTIHQENEDLPRIIIFACPSSLIPK